MNTDAIFPNIRTRTLKDNTIEFSSWVRIKIKKTWYDMLVLDTYSIDSTNLQKELIDCFNRFNNRCYSVKYCHLSFSKKFIDNNKDIIIKSKIQISDKNRTYLKNIINLEQVL